MNDSDENVMIVPDPVSPPEDRVKDDRLMSLGQQFLKSLQDDDVQKFCGCWFSADERLQQLKAEGGIEWTPDVIAHYRKLYELEIELVAIYHAIYRASLINHCERLQDITLDHVEKTADATTVYVCVRLPNGSLFEFQIDGAEETEGRWTFYGQPSPLIMTQTKDGISETITTRPPTHQLENDLNRVLSEIEEAFSE